MAPGRGGLRSRAQEVSLSLRQLSLACCGRRLPRRRQSPAHSRRAVGCMSSSRLYSPPPPPPPVPPSSPPAAVTVPACKLLAGNKRLRSGRAGASPPPSRRAARPARPLLAGSARLAGGSLLLPAPPRPGNPPGSPGARSGEPRGGGRRRSRGGGREKERPERRERERRRGLETEAPKEELLRGSGRWSQDASRWAQQAHAPRAPRTEGKPRPREGERKGAALCESPPRRSNPLTKESPALLLPVRPPARPRWVPTRWAQFPVQGRANPEGAPPPPPATRLSGKGHSGPHLPAGSCRLQRTACLALQPKAVRVPPMSPLARPCRAQEHSSLKAGTFRVSEGIQSRSETKLLDKLQVPSLSPYSCTLGFGPFSHQDISAHKPE